VSAAEPAKERLRQAIESLRADIDRVEFWADALDGLARPVPNYEATDRLSQHLLSQLPRRGSTEHRDIVRTPMCISSSAIARADRRTISSSNAV
jgi:hypothetical protein